MEASVRVLRVWRCARESAVRRGKHERVASATLLGARPKSNSRDGENEQRAMALMNTPKRGVIIRSMRSTETDVETLLQAATEELRQLREERVQQRLREQEIIVLLTQRDESVRRLEERLGQISGESNPIPSLS